MKKHKPLCALLCTLLLAGCASAPASENNAGGRGGTGGAGATGAPTGRYVEEDHTPAGLGRAVEARELADGGILLIGTNDTGRVDAWRAAEGETQPLDTTALNDFLASLELELRHYTMDDDGTWWVANYSTGGECRLYRLPPGGAPQIVSVPLFESPAPSGWMSRYVNRLVCGGDGTLLMEVAHNQQKSYVLLDTAAASVLHSFTAPGYPDLMGFRGGMVYLMAANSMTLEVYAAAGGTLADSMVLPAGTEDLRHKMTGTSLAADGALCYAAASGIHKIALGGSMLQTVVDNRSFTFALPDFRPVSILEAADGSVWIASNLGVQEGRLNRYVFDENAPALPESSLYLWAMEDNVLLRGALSAFARQNPGCEITAEFGRSSANSAMTDEDIIRALNARLLAGDAPDVLILDGLPANSLIRQGMLLELDGLVDEGDFYANILGAYKQDGKTWALPAAFRLPVLAQREGAPGPAPASLGTVSELQALLTQSGSVYFGGYRPMFEALYPAFAPFIFPGGERVDEDALREFLALTDAVAKSHGLAGFEQDPITGGFTVTSGDGEPETLSPGLTMFGANGGAQGRDYAADILNQFSDYMRLALDHGTPQLAPLPGGAYIPVCAAAVPVNAQNPEDGRLFVKTLLEFQDEGVAAYRGLPGFLVKRDVCALQAQRNYERMLQEVLDDEIPPMNPALVGWNALFEGYALPSSTDGLLEEKLYNEARALYGGIVNLEDTVQAVLRSTKLYFAERE